MEIITTTNLNDARKQAEKLKKENKPVILLSQDDEFNRKALEIRGLKILLINENLNQKDYMKQRSSGLNEILAKICADKKIEVGINIDEIVKKTDANKAKSLARLAQNIKLCKRTKTKLTFITNKDYDLQALASILLTLGASNEQI